MLRPPLVIGPDLSRMVPSYYLTYMYLPPRRAPLFWSILCWPPLVIGPDISRMVPSYHLTYWPPRRVPLFWSILTYMYIVGSPRDSAGEVGSAFSATHFSPLFLFLASSQQRGWGAFLCGQRAKLSSLVLLDLPLPLYGCCFNILTAQQQCLINTCLHNIILFSYALAFLKIDSSMCLLISKIHLHVPEYIY